MNDAPEVTETIENETVEESFLFPLGQPVVVTVELPDGLSPGNRRLNEVRGTLLGIQPFGVVLTAVSWQGKTRDRLLIPWTQIKGLY